MRIVALDDEKLILKMLEMELCIAVPDAEITVFSDPDDLLGYAAETEIDVAFLDIQLGTMNGVDVAKAIKDRQPYVNIIFCTGYEEYMPDAFQIRASDYLMKPVTAEKVRHALESLRYPPKLRVPEGKLYLRCYGQFEVFYNGNPLENLPKRAKELLAYLVYQRGALCSTRELMSSVFGDLSDSYFRVARMDLENALREVGQEDILVKQWGKLGVDTRKFMCDWYEYAMGNPAAVNLYEPEFMAQYQWAKAETARK